MASNKLSELSKEDLLKKEKGSKIVIGICLGYAALRFAMSLWWTLNDQNFKAMTVFSVFILILFIIGIRNLREVQKELKSRN